MDQLLAGHPFWKMAFDYLGGAAIVWEIITEAIPRMTALLLPLVVHFVQWLVCALMAHPAVKAALKDPGTRAKVEAVLGQFADMVAQIAKAAAAEANRDIEAAEDPPAPPAAAPKA